MSLDFSKIELQSAELNQIKEIQQEKKKAKIALIAQHKDDLFTLFNKKLFAGKNVAIGNGGTTVSAVFGDYSLSFLVTNISNENGMLINAPEKNLKLVIQKKLKDKVIFEKLMADVTDYETLTPENKKYRYATTEEELNFEDLVNIFQTALDAPAPLS